MLVYQRVVLSDTPSPPKKECSFEVLFSNFSFDIQPWKSWRCILHICCQGRSLSTSKSPSLKESGSTERLWKQSSDCDQITPPATMMGVVIQWLCLRENLWGKSGNQWKPWFCSSNTAASCRVSLPIPGFMGHDMSEQMTCQISLQECLARCDEKGIWGMVPRCSKFCGIDVNQRHSKVTGSQSEIPPGVICLGHRGHQVSSSAFLLLQHWRQRMDQGCKALPSSLASVDFAEKCKRNITSDIVKLVEGKQNLAN